MHTQMWIRIVLFLVMLFWSLPVDSTKATCTVPSVQDALLYNDDGMAPIIEGDQLYNEQEVFIACKNDNVIDEEPFEATYKRIMCSNGTWAELPPKACVNPRNCDIQAPEHSELIVGNTFLEGGSRVSQVELTCNRGFKIFDGSKRLSKFKTRCVDGNLQKVIPYCKQKYASNAILPCKILNTDNYSIVKAKKRRNFVPYVKHRRSFEVRCKSGKYYGIYFCYDGTWARHLPSCGTCYDGVLVQELPSCAAQKSKDCQLPSDPRYRFDDGNLSPGEKVTNGQLVRVACVKEMFDHYDDGHGRSRNTSILCHIGSIFGIDNMECEEVMGAECKKSVQHGVAKDSFRGIIVSCDDGYTLTVSSVNSGYQCLNGTVVTQSDHNEPKCIPKGCGQPTDVDGAVFVDDRKSKLNTFGHGTVVHYKCDYGRQLKGFYNNRTCQLGRWTEPNFECKSTCTVPAVQDALLYNNDGMVPLTAGDKLYNEQEVLIACLNDNVIDDEPFEATYKRIMCSNGTWAELPPKACVNPRNCDIKASEHSELIVGNTFLEGGSRVSQVELTCNRGFKIFDGSKRLSQFKTRCVDGNLQKEIPFCKRNGGRGSLPCKFPNTDIYSIVYARRRRRFKPYVKHHSSIDVRCRSGKVNGLHKTKCYDGTWIPKLPSCAVQRSKDCQLPIDARYRFDDGNLSPGEKVTNGQLVKVACVMKMFDHYDDGHGRSRNTSILCHSGSIFGIDNMECEKVGCRPPNTEAAIINPLSFYNETDRVELTCRVGYRLEGDLNLTCLKTGKWTGSAVCVEVHKKYYRVQVTTGDQETAGTKGHVFLKIYGKTGYQTNEIELKQNFYRNTRHYFFDQVLDDVGEISHIETRLQTVTNMDTWYLMNVIIYDNKGSKFYRFPVRQWLNEQKPIVTIYPNEGLKSRQCGDRYDSQGFPMFVSNGWTVDITNSLTECQMVCSQYEECYAVAFLYGFCKTLKYQQWRQYYRYPTPNSTRYNVYTRINCTTV